MRPSDGPWSLESCGAGGLSMLRARLVEACAARRDVGHGVLLAVAGQSFTSGVEITRQGG
jgi:hypothetical protein